MNTFFKNVSVSEFCKGKKAVLISMHEKEQVIAPPLHSLGISLETTTLFHTDALGTFAGDVERPGTQEQTLRMKVQQGLTLVPNSDFIVASEGSFNPHPDSPFITLNTEMVMLYHPQSGLEVIGHHFTTDVSIASEKVRTAEELRKFCDRVGFPEYGIILKTADRQVMKDFASMQQMMEACYQLHASAKEVIAETDMRAHRNPLRMQSIGKAAENLVSNLMKVCPACYYPGFQVTGAIKGLPCEHCGLPTRITKSEISHCANCRHTEEKMFPAGKETAYAGYCDFCNP